VPKRLIVCALALSIAACKRGNGAPQEGGVANTDPNVWTAANVGPGRATAINSAGEALIVNETDPANGTFLLYTTGKKRSLGSFAGGLDGGTLTVGVALSSSGTAAGYAETATGRVAVINAGAGWTRLAGLSGKWSAAVAIDDSGAIAGVIGTDAGTLTGFLWANGAQQPLAVPTDGKNSAGYALGASGVLAGIVEGAGGATHPFVIQNGALTDLGVLAGGTSATAYAVNSAGLVVGSSEATGGLHHAFSARAGSALTDLGVPSGFAWSEARGVDAAGRIVINAVTAQSVSRPFVLLAGKPPVDLLPNDSTGAPFASAHAAAMSSNGRISGWAVTSSGKVEAMVWTPGGLQ
jgi:probable HAF family extracellular repeat protein